MNKRVLNPRNDVPLRTTWSPSKEKDLVESACWVDRSPLWSYGPGTRCLVPYFPDEDEQGHTQGVPGKSA